MKIVHYTALFMPLTSGAYVHNLIHNYLCIELTTESGVPVLSCLDLLMMLLYLMSCCVERT